jgi:hypothetical protein
MKTELLQNHPPQCHGFGAKSPAFFAQGTGQPRVGLSKRSVRTIWHRSRRYCDSLGGPWCLDLTSVSIVRRMERIIGKVLEDIP